MIPIHDLLHRIRWDPVFGKGAFELGYEDHVAAHVVRAVWRNGELIWNRPARKPV